MLCDLSDTSPCCRLLILTCLSVCLSVYQVTICKFHLTIDSKNKYTIIIEPGSHLFQEGGGDWGVGLPLSEGLLQVQAPVFDTSFRRGGGGGGGYYFWNFMVLFKLFVNELI